MKKIDKEKCINQVKAAGEIACDMFAQAFICGISRAILPPGVNAIVKGAMLAGGLLMGGFVGSKMNGYFDEQVDDAVKSIEDTVSEIKHCVEIIQDIKDEETEEVEVG